MQPARNLVGIAALSSVLLNLPPACALGHDDLGGADTSSAWMSTGMPRPLSRTEDAVIGVDFHNDFGGVSGKRLVNALSTDFIGPYGAGPESIVSIADVHARAFATRL